MGLVTRFFAPVSAGSGDGTSWNNRAALFTTGNWSSVLTGFNFASDSLLAIVGPGSYTCNQTLTLALFTTSTPTSNTPLAIHAGDSDGNLWSVPSGWSSAQPVNWDANLPVITVTSSSLCQLSGARHFSFTGIKTNGGVNDIFWNGPVVNWCYCENFTGNSYAFRTVTVHNSAVDIAAVGGRVTDGGNGMDNVRMRYTAGGSSAFAPVQLTAANQRYRGLTIIGFSTGITSSTVCYIYGSTFVNNAIAISGRMHAVQDCFISGSTTGVNITSDSSQVLRNRIRATTPISGSNVIDANNAIAAGSDAAEFADPEALDYRIKSASIYHGMSLGAGDELAIGGGTTFPPIGPGGLVF